MVVKKKRVLTVSFVLMVFLSAAIGTQIPLTKANPNPLQTYAIYAGDISPPENAKPPTISLLSPVNQSYHSRNNVTFNLEINVLGTPLTYSTILGLGYDPPTTVYINPGLKEVYFEAEWLQNKTLVEPNQTISLNLTEIPEGKQSITVYAVEWRPNQKLSINEAGLGKVMRYNGFYIVGSSVINFTIDTIAPIVSILSLENKTYYSPKVKLDFNVSESSSQVIYSLDRKENVTLSENTVLTGLANGDHNVTVYAVDEAGNIASQTIYFSIAEPFPTVPATAVAVTLLATGLLVYFKKRRMKSGDEK